MTTKEDIQNKHIHNRMPANIHPKAFEILDKAGYVPHRPSLCFQKAGDKNKTISYTGLWEQGLMGPNIEDHEPDKGLQWLKDKLGIK